MPTTYHRGRVLAIAAGLASTAGALAILLADPLTTGTWKLDHGLLPVVVFITIAAGHLARDAACARRPLSALGFVGLFAIGTVLTVYSSVGSQKAATGDKALSIEASNAAITAKQAEIVKSRARLDSANSEADREMTGQTCGKRCENWRLRAREVTSHIATLEAELRGLGTQRTARPKAEAFAEAASVFGFDKGQVAHAATILEPFAYSLLLELSAIVCFSFGFVGPAVRRPSLSDTRQTSFPAPASLALFAGDLPEPPEPPRGPRKVSKLPENVVIQFPSQHPALSAIEKAGGSVASHEQLATLMGCSAGETSKRVAEVAHLLTIERCGKFKRLRLRA